MTDHEFDDSPEHEEVRRLLAGARHDEPMPAAVAARLERVLDDLAEQAPAPVPWRPVTSLATRRRRVAQLLVAAAAVAVVGIGIGQVVDSGGGSGDSAGTADAGADYEADAPAATDAESGEDPGAAPLPEAAEPQDTAAGGPEVWRLTSSDLPDQARELSSAYSRSMLAGTLDRADALVSSCLARQWGKGAFVPVTYDGSPGVLVFRRPRGDTQVADVFLCGSPNPLRSVTLPVP